VSDPIDRINEAMEINSETLREGGERFQETLRSVNAERAKRKAEEDKKFERKMLARRIARYALWTASAYFTVKAIRAANETSED
jgi:hypothetical protein